MTYAELVEHLEKPENADDMQYLAYLKNFEYLQAWAERQKDRPLGFGGRIVKWFFHLEFVKVKMSDLMDAKMALAACENAADLVAFKQSEHFQQIKAQDLGDIEHPKQLVTLEALKELADE